MKNQNELRIVTILKSVFNVRAWIDYDRLKYYTFYILGMGKRLFVPDPQEAVAKKQSFQEAMSALNLKEQDLITRQTALYRLSIYMLVLGLGLLSYALYQMVKGSVHAFILGTIVALIALVLSFRYHFWYFQIKERKLGCSFREWYRYGLLGGKR